ncbi:MAG TPA: hypothetical protein VNQ77_12100 [Frankiaceae bacterium]|nr:hypothetical protein [Frankiaceae bacterium]
MVGQIGPLDAWLVVADVAGVLAVLAAWLLLSGAGDRARAYGAAAGAALVALGLGSALFRVSGNVSNLTLDAGLPGSNIAAYAVLLVAGVAAGVGAVVAARRRETGTGRLPLELAVVAVAVALPSLVHPAGERAPDRWEVTAAVVAVHVLSGVVVAGGLLVVLGYDDDPPAGAVAGAFALVAVVTVAGWVWQEQVANEHWAMVATGLAAGLLAAVALPLLRDVVPADASAVVAGVLAVLVVLVLAGLANGQAFREYGELQGERSLDLVDEGNDGPRSLPYTELPTP